MPTVNVTMTETAVATDAVHVTVASEPVNTLAPNVRGLPRDRHYQQRLARAEKGYVGQDTLSIVGKVREGEWRATPIAPEFGGTGNTTPFEFMGIAYGDGNGGLTSKAADISQLAGNLTLNQLTCRVDDTGTPANAAIGSTIRLTNNCSIGAMDAAGVVPYKLLVLDATNTLGLYAGRLTIANNNAASLVGTLTFYSTNGPAVVTGMIDKTTASAAFNTLGTGTDTTIYTVTVKANSLGANGGVRMRIGGDILCNSGAPTWRLTIQLGGTILWADVSNAFGASATRFPWYADFVVGNAGATNSQVVIGLVVLGRAVAAITGEGSLNTAPTSWTPVYGTAAEDTTIDRNLTVRVRPSVSNVAVEITRKWAVTEILP